MKKALLIFPALMLLLVAILGSTSCDKAVNCDELNATYNNKMKAIIDAKCVTCHKLGGQAESVGIYTSYNSMKPNFESAWTQVNTGKMPPAGSPDLSSDEKDAFECWSNSNFPEN